MSKKRFDLEIRNLSIRQPQIIIHDNQPAVPFSLTTIAKSEMGKTNVIVNLILKYVKKKIFNDNIFIFQKTPDLAVKKQLIDNKK